MRLLTSVLFAAAACTFVVGYDRMSQIRYRIDHPTAEGYWASPGEFVLENQTDGGKFITAYRGYAYAVPLAGLLLGILVIWRWPRFPRWPNWSCPSCGSSVSCGPVLSY